MFKKYRPRVHFKCEPCEYVVRLDSLTHDEVEMNEDHHTFHKNLSYHKDFGHTKVNFSMQRTQSTGTHAFVGASNGLERKKSFNEDRVIPL